MIEDLQVRDAAQAWRVGEILSLAAQSFKRQWAVLLVAAVLRWFVPGVPGLVVTILVRTGALDARSSVYLGAACLQMLAGVVLRLLL